MEIRIDKNTCIKCGKCVRVCPNEIMTQSKKGDEIGLQDVESCIVCGHCVDVCPTDSVLHGEFPKEKIHAVDYSMMPAPEQLMMLIKSRRSNRSITETPIPKEMLAMITEAALYAPTAMNSRQVSCTVITDADQLKQIGDFTINVFGSLAKKLNNPLIKGVLKPFMGGIYKYLPKFERLKREHEAGNDPILRKATAVLVFHTPESNGWGDADANLAYQNASLMAQSLGVSQVYMGFVLRAVKQDGKGTLAEMLGIKGRIYAVMALGMPAFQYPKYTERNA